MPNVRGTHVRIFESSQLEGSYVGDLLYYLQVFCLVSRYGDFHVIFLLLISSLILL